MDDKPSSGLPVGAANIDPGQALAVASGNGESLLFGAKSFMRRGAKTPAVNGRFWPPAEFRQAKTWGRVHIKITASPWG